MESLSAPPPRRASRRERRKQITRSELIRAGRKLFRERGLYEARIEDLAEHADVAKGTVYLYFQGKADLIRAVIAEGFASLEERVQSETQAATSPEMYVERAVDAHVQFFGEHLDLMRILHQARGMLAFGRAEWRPLRAPLERHLSFLAGCLARARGAGRVSARDRELAIAIFGCVSGVSSIVVALGLRLPPVLAPDLRGALAAMAGPRRPRSAHRPSAGPRLGRNRRERRAGVER